MLRSARPDQASTWWSPTEICMHCEPGEVRRSFSDMLRRADGAIRHMPGGTPSVPRWPPGRWPTLLAAWATRLDSGGAQLHPYERRVCSVRIPRQSGEPSRCRGRACSIRAEHGFGPTERGMHVRPLARPVPACSAGHPAMDHLAGLIARPAGTPRAQSAWALSVRAITAPTVRAVQTHGIATGRRGVSRGCWRNTSIRSWRRRPRC